MAREQHGIEPVYDARSRILILGSFPSVKSRETQFFYGHPQNRFWRVLAAVTGQETPGSIPEKKEISSTEPDCPLGCDKELRD